jgi:hypothetical protein|uniref:Uncharacterized protein n=1 Tax=virus sp. ctE0n6 TaxID=2827985 RepID=A0A8S5RF73_9VIRU|nr:MAG TPA: hypothetical protein [virus sp. ctE0n6]
MKLQYIKNNLKLLRVKEIVILIVKLIQGVLVTHICLDIGISYIEKGNKPKAFYYFMMWFLYLVTFVAIW